MVVLTDQDGLYDADPRVTPGAKFIPQASVNDNRLTAMAGRGASLGRGGMLTKLSAARLAARSGTNTVIANGSEEQVLIRLLQGEALGTLLEADREPVTARKQWLAGQLSLKGKLTLDAGAVEVLQKSGKSLLAVGIQSVQGQFSRGDVVACVDGSGQEIARGLINYDVNEIEKLKGVSSDKIEQLLGYVGEEEVIHRDNMVISDSSSN